MGNHAHKEQTYIVLIRTSYKSGKCTKLVVKPLAASCFFQLIGIHSMQDWTTTARHGVTSKRDTKRLRHTENLFRKNFQLKDVH